MNQNLTRNLIRLNLQAICLFLWCRHTHTDRSDSRPPPAGELAMEESCYSNVIRLSFSCCALFSSAVLIKYNTDKKATEETRHALKFVFKGLRIRIRTGVYADWVCLYVFIFWGFVRDFWCITVNGGTQEKHTNMESWLTSTFKKKKKTEEIKHFKSLRFCPDVCMILERECVNIYCMNEINLSSFDSLNSWWIFASISCFRWQRSIKSHGIINKYAPHPGRYSADNWEGEPAGFHSASGLKKKDLKFRELQPLGNWVEQIEELLFAHSLRW